MDILSFLLGYDSGKSNGSVSTDDIDDFLDQINGEVIGENLYYVTFVDEAGTELCKIGVYDGYNCPNPLTNGILTNAPTKASDKYYSYTYSGWTRVKGGTASASALNSISKDTTIYPAFTAEKIYIVQGEWSYKYPGETNEVYWGLDPDYAMYIWGSGTMGNSSYGHDTPPWYEYRNDIISVDVESGVTCVCNHAFQDCAKLTTANLADTVKAIGQNAFENCTSLSSVNVPNGVSMLIGQVFKNCKALASITLPSTLIAFVVDCFGLCDNLNRIVFAAPSGWKVRDETGGAVLFECSAEQMSDPEQAATLVAEQFALNSNRQFDKYNL